MKKLKIAIVLIASVLFVISCGNNQADDYPRAGSWVESDMFVNEWLGVQFQLPAGWDVPFRGELERMGLIVLENADIEISEEILEAMEEGAAVYDMYATNYFTRSSASIAFERLPRNARNVDMGSKLENIMEDMKQEFPISEATIHSDTALIGELEFYVLDAVFDVMGRSSYMISYTNLEGRNLRTIMIFSSNQEELDHIWGYFNIVGAERIESVAPEYDIPEVDLNLVEEDFIGIWDRVCGLNYKYEFFDDGTAVRGFPRVQEEFTWTLVDGELHLRLRGRMELWVPIIDGDVLTLTSLRSEGISHSFIRR